MGRRGEKRDSHKCQVTLRTFVPSRAMVRTCLDEQRPARTGSVEGEGEIRRQSALVGVPRSLLQELTTHPALPELDTHFDVPPAPWPGKLDHFRVGRLDRLGGDVLLDPLSKSPQPPTVLDGPDPAVEHPVPGLGVRASKKSGDLPDRHEVLASRTPRDGGVPVCQPRIDLGLQEQRLAPVVFTSSSRSSPYSIIGVSSYRRGHSPGWRVPKVMSHRRRVCISCTCCMTECIYKYKAACNYCNSRLPATHRLGPPGTAARPGRIHEFIPQQSIFDHRRLQLQART